MGTTATWTQDNRPIAVTTPLGKDKLLLESFSGVEEISMPFRFLLQMVSPETDIASSRLLGKDAHIAVKGEEGETKRYIHGIVSRFVQLGRDSRTGLTTYEAELVPELWLLSLGSDCRIFQEMTGLDVIKQVFSDAGFSKYSVKCEKAKSAPKREYCVQYRETHLQFVSRLMEEEGIFYYFEHTQSGHTLVLADQGTPLDPCPGTSSLKVVVSGTHDFWEEVVTDLQSEFAVTSRSYAVTDYNPETSALDLLQQETNQLAGRVLIGEQYDYPGRINTRNAASTEAARRLDRLHAAGAIVRGWSNCPALCSGYKLSLEDHYRDDLNTAYRLLRVEHYGISGGFSTGEEGAASYRNGFVGVPASANYLPPQITPKPLVHGSQTAMVVGKSGEEIWTDSDGRVKVQFFWDRRGKEDDKSSCWVRVASVWAGKGFGWVHIPRIGEEVVVSFLEGDPDRPLITGRVYNDKHVPPWDLPGDQTKSGMRTRSSKTGGEKNYSELWFDDKKGSEMVFLHAEKDLTTEVEHDETRTVGHNRTTTIEQDESRTVKKGNDTTFIEQGNQDIKVHGTQNTIVQTGHQNIRVLQGNQTIDVMQGNQNINVKQGNQTTVLDMGTMHRVIKMGNQTLQLDMGNQTVKANLGKIENQAMMGIELTVGQSSIKIDQMGVTIKGMMIKIEGQIQTEVKGMMTQINGSAMLQAQGGITMIG